MKNTLLLLAAVALTATCRAQTPAAATPASSASRPAPAQRAERQIQTLTQELNLTAEQAPKVERIVQAQQQELQALRAQTSGGGNRRKLFQQLKASQEKYNGQFRAVLTPEQFTRYEQLQAQRREQLRAARQNRQ
ncbi:hypothetical protein [Hymenobacter sp.]|uniref:hypothetical protein n=1 Tax=Hymenobacter sp. TaxID=1898978 RepID=UPI00286C767C|nr:hypothetical protein [Hymenobacter sp.]